jgi:pyruvate-formate lyase-activating enzyme
VPESDAAERPDRLADSDAFCILPWLHLATSVDGRWARCCMDNSLFLDNHYGTPGRPRLTLHPDAIGCVEGSAYARDNPDRTLGFAEAFDSPQMRETRRLMLRGRKVRACSNCYRQEGAGGRSYRQKANEMFAAQLPLQRVVDDTAADGSYGGFPMYLDLRLGNTCNLTCIMCDYPISSSWGRQRLARWAPAHIAPYRLDGRWWDELATNARRVRRLYLAGGEPLLQPLHRPLLDMLIERGAASRIELFYNTNLTVLPPDVLTRWSGFASVEIGASCDGVEEVFERIRTGARWPVFVANLQTARRHARVRLQVAPQRDNVFELGRLVDWALEQGLDIDLTNLVHHPPHLSVRALAAPDRARAAQALRAWIATYDRLGHASVVADLRGVLSLLTSGGAANPATLP